jgi:hypothetical protein
MRGPGTLATDRSTAREDCREAFRRQLAELDEGAEVAPSPAVQLCGGTGETGIVEDGDHEDVGRDLPRSIGDDTDLHEPHEPPGAIDAVVAAEVGAGRV